MSEQIPTIMPDTRTFIEALFGKYFREHTGYIEYRAIGKRVSTDGKDATIIRQHFYPSLEAALSETAIRELTGWNESGLNIYAGVLPRFQEHGKKEDVKFITCIWADIDFKDFLRGEDEAWQTIKAFPIIPSKIVRTGHGLHLYWYLHEALEITDPRKIEGIIKGVAKALNGDHVFDLSRVLRVPGFTNYKKDMPPVPCELLHEYFRPELQYDLSDFEIYFIDPGQTTSAANLEDTPKDVPERFYQLLKTDPKLRDTYYGRRKLLNDNSRSGFDMSLAQQLKQYNFSDGEIATILMQSPSGKGKDASPQYLAHTIGKTKGLLADSENNSLMSMLESIPTEILKHQLPNALDEFFHVLACEPQAQITAMLFHAVKLRFGLKNDDIKSYLKTVLAYKKELVTEEQNEEEEVETFTDEERAAGKKLLQSPTPLNDVLSILKRSGLVGEEGNALIHYLALTSRILSHPISITVKGDSSAGKSFTLGKVMELMPKSAYIDLTDATPQSFYYGKPDQFKHRIIVIFERNGAERADYTIRSLQSEGKLKIQVTVKNPVTGAFEAKTIEREGPTGFITTTTSSQIHAENETRNLSIFPDQTTGQTQRIYSAANARYLGKKTLNQDEVRSYRAAQTLLQSYPVIIPYVEGLDAHFPEEILRTRRDYPRFLSIIEVSALLHQEQRSKSEIAGITYIKASLADYEIARSLCEGSLARSIYELPPKTLELIDAIKEFVSGLSKLPDEDSTFTLTDIAKHLKWDRDTVDKWLKPALKKTIVTQTEEGRGKKGARYRLENDAVCRTDSFLPSVDVIAYQNPDEPLKDIYNPLTGEIIEIRMVDVLANLRAVSLTDEVNESDSKPSMPKTQPPASSIQSALLDEPF